MLAGVKKSSVELANLTEPFDPDELDICVFVERECSIQRRHQKVIEESPSCLLTEETRRKMVKQVKALVRQVGYTSAGTVEWLVDETQNFYFLEMNTRLQVEHPITEAVSDVDLVKGMLHIGAGWGLPQDFLDKLGHNEYMPYFGHAVEGRIYAEDPLRGFLPSTGPLIPYQEPVLEGVRVDSGVTQGHVVSPHYDPMLAKVICYAEKRKDAVEGLAVALDNYVIEGVQHNARLVNSVLRHPVFIEGKTPTSFLPTHYPDGFHGVELTTKQKDRLAAIMVMVGKIRQEALKSPLVPGSSDEIIVKLGGMFGEALSVKMLDETAATIKDVDGKSEERIVTLDAPLEYKPVDLLARAWINDKLVTVQVRCDIFIEENRNMIHTYSTPVSSGPWRGCDR